MPPTFRAGNSCLASLPEPGFNKCHPPFAIGATHLSCRQFMLSLPSRGTIEHSIGATHLSRSVPPTFSAGNSCLACLPEGPLRFESMHAWPGRPCHELTEIAAFNKSIQSVPPTFRESISCLASFPEQQHSIIQSVPPTFRAGNSCLACLPEGPLRFESMHAWPGRPCHELTEIAAFNRCHPPFAMGGWHRLRRLRAIRLGLR